MTFHDEDIDQELPLCIDDEQLRFGLSPEPVVCGPSVTSGSVAQIRLSRILAPILRAFYGIRSPSTEEHFALAEKFSKELSEWRDRISYLLDAGGSSAIFVKLVLRQRDVLKLAYWHAQILVYRPFLQEQTQQNIKSCIDAAMSIAEHIGTIDAAGEFYSTLFNYNARARKQFDDLNTGSNAATSQIENPTEDQLVNANTGTVASVDALNTGLFQIIDWGQFDSLVTGGIGSLDAFVLGEPNEAWENINTADFNT
ncbi:hypothetical protein KHU50_008781 [Colletotrichum sp. SAR 10_65]|nr:hypothetical protein K4K51_001090 [Colletotrichum sp. SAR 10_75]KAI8198355.1 hypothetical protein KHU50_008781 [Colletotrichum sp. SAR 10_65]KAI8263791.1 hypothetical protein K4K53_006185 [Colletotrichum sp. SAR 10_77]